MMKYRIMMLAALLRSPNFALPLFSGQPDPLTNSVSLNAALTNHVTVSSGNAPVRLQWRFNGSDLPGATNRFLELSNVGAGNAGLYTVVASDTTGSSESKPWTVQVDSAFSVMLLPSIVR